MKVSSRVSESAWSLEQSRLLSELESLPIELLLPRVKSLARRIEASPERFAKGFSTEQALARWLGLQLTIMLPKKSEET